MIQFLGFCLKLCKAQFVPQRVKKIELRPSSPQTRISYLQGLWYQFKLLPCSIFEYFIAFEKLMHNDNHIDHQTLWFYFLLPTLKESTKIVILYQDLENILQHFKMPGNNKYMTKFWHFVFQIHVVLCINLLNLSINTTNII